MSVQIRRHFLPETFVISNWAELEPFCHNLLERKWQNSEDFLAWLKDLSELEAVFSEDLAWRYIRFTCDTTNKELQDRYEYFVNEIEPPAAKLFNQLHERIADSPFLKDLDDALYGIYKKLIQNELKMFREKNIPVFSQISTKSQEYGQISGAQTIVVDVKELTLQQAAVFLKNPDREKRCQVYEAIQQRRSQDKKQLDQLLDELTVLRQEVATNAGYSDYAAYSFDAMARFDYTSHDCFQFHAAIESAVVPVMSTIEKQRQEAMQLEELMPYDLDVDVSGKPAVKPFAGGNELIDKTITCLNKIDADFAGYISTMSGLGHFDLDSRIGKAPGGYNYPLAETGAPFIFMNSAGTLRDLVTMVHEAGHAVHSFLMNHLPLKGLKDPPSEVCELASMSMELLTMEHWDVFIPDREELRRAKIEQLEKVIATLPWVAAVDAFQHWLYTNKNHTAEQRDTAWVAIIGRFDSGVVNWQQYQQFRNYSWQRQLHIYEVPFYYIEYGMAQLGALAVWRNYKQDPSATLTQFKNALKLGYTTSIPEIYKAAGIKFDFSKSYVEELMNFVQTELNNLKVS